MCEQRNPGLGCTLTLLIPPELRGFPSWSYGFPFRVILTSLKLDWGVGAHAEPSLGISTSLQPFLALWHRWKKDSSLLEEGSLRPLQFSLLPSSPTSSSCSLGLEKEGSCEPEHLWSQSCPPTMPCKNALPPALAFSTSSLLQHGPKDVQL